MLGEAVALVSAKALVGAKSRISAPRALRQRIALELLERTRTATSLAESIAYAVVVAGDDDVAEAARRRGARSIREPGPYGLNAAIHAGRAWLRDAAPHLVVCVLVGDLAAAEPADVDDLGAELPLRRGPRDVADHEGTGPPPVDCGTADRRATKVGVASA